MLAMLIIVILGKALTFLMPLYIEIIQGGSSFQTAVYLIPYQLSLFVAAVLIVRLYGTLSPRQIARYSFVIVAVGFVGLGIKFQNDWNDSGGHFISYRDRHRPGRAGDAPVQRAGNFFAEAIRGRRRLAARHDQ